MCNRGIHPSGSGCAGKFVAHTMAPVKYLRLIISLEYELVPEKVHLISACRETKSSCSFSGLRNNEET